MAISPDLPDYIPFSVVDEALNAMHVDTRTLRRITFDFTQGGVVTVEHARVAEVGGPSLAAGIHTATITTTIGIDRRT